MYKRGIDVSYWDQKMDWSLYTWDFAFIKVSEGTVIDPMFYAHWMDAKGRTQRGGYHFFRAFVDPKLAVQRFLTYLGLDEGELPPALDLEDIDQIDVKTSVSRALTWLVEYEKITGVKPIIYSSPSFINDTLKLYLYPDFADYDIWLAIYPYDNYSIATRGIKIHSTLLEPDTLILPPTPKPFKRIKYYQWTAKGSPSDVPGYYTGTGGKLAVDFNFEIDSQPTGDETMKEGTVEGVLLAPLTKLNIRDAASVTARDLGDLFDKDRVYGEVASGWIKFDKIIRANGTVEMFTGYASTAYMTLRDAPIVPPGGGLQPLNVQISGDGYETVNVELKPK